MRRKRGFLQGTFLAAVCLLAVLLPGREVYAGFGDNNIVIVLDASGSMAGTMGSARMARMDAAKTALKEVLKDVPEDTNIGLLVFGASNLEEEWAYPLGPRDDRQLMAAIDRPIPNGTTPLGAFIKKGADRLLKQREKQFGYGTYRLLIVTDGEASDTGVMERYVPEVIARGITVDVIGVDMKFTHTLATKVHTYRKADDPATLKQAVREVFAELADTGADAADEDAFEQIAAIPDEMATAMLAALSSSGNHPIGEKPPVKREPEEASNEMADTTGDSPDPQAAVPGDAGQGQGGGGGGVTLFALLTFLFVGYIVVRKLTGKR